MSFQQGLSGLNAASKTLEAIGNNIANTNTAGFKSSQVQFADVYANSLTGGGSQNGIGTKVAGISQQFTQGNISGTNNPLDMAVNGNGFFKLQGTDGVPVYSRNGQFTLDRVGNIVNSSGAQLMGYLPNAAGTIGAGERTKTFPLKIDLSADSPPNPTSELTTAVNLDSRETQPAVAFDPAVRAAGTYNSASSATVYDSKGVPHVMETFYVKQNAPAPSGSWNVFARMDTETTARQISTLTFNADGSFNTQTDAAPMPTFPGASGANPISIDFDFSKSTEFGVAFSVNSINQNGFAPGQLSSYSIDSSGTIFGRYSNGQSKVLGQVVLSTFPNPNGLQPLGNNVWQSTFASNDAVENQPGEGDNGVIQSSAVEDSNVDMTAELVNMITAQRVYQANAQTIKTQDQVLQTLVNLR
ncbi:flagellar hook protein FlgE [Noviherbaspirillum aerium]|uniref:flagellar hook protein FlgE n=1 Tax=Noviherbaspirillum aerium TaxID=2588497 RepID=UPI00124EDB09|nr:flagellar hook protein FlgE [Noviherbaspirillum aerium]